MKKKREYIRLLCIIALGIVFGVLSKAADVAVQGNILGNIFFYFGLISSGFFIWVVICTIISILSKNKIWAMVNVFFFLAAMILVYYLYSYFIVNYLVLSVIKFWIIMLVPSTILSFVVWNIKISRVLKYTVIAIGAVIMVFDMFVFQGAVIGAMVIDIILYAIFLSFILSKRFNKA